MKKLIVLNLLILCLTGWSQKQESLIFREKIYDFGEITEAGGNVEYEFIFTNTSGFPVKIISVQASCGCTTPGWSQSPVLPGKAGFIKASFDPRGRPGYFNKTLTVVTDLDPNPVILQIKGVVKTEIGGSKSEFSVAFGNLMFASRSFNFNKVYINQPPVQKEFYFTNAGQNSISLINASGPPHLKIEIPFVIGSKAKGIIRITYDAKQRGQFGFAPDNIQLVTNDPGNEIKLIPVYATVEEYFPVPTPEEARRSPSLQIKEPTVDLGRFGRSELIERNVTIINTGKKELLIRALLGNCPCISAEVEKKSIRPGDSTHLKISFKPQNRSGTQMKAVTVYSNDPLNPVQRIDVQAYIESDN
ncbi:MAG TPA: DUF1573 domain-containing protein [Cyclobacteriaceae bacterium]|nr:DUF1573 domain-containing protein [Cyclobacteriaceae bacterium]